MQPARKTLWRQTGSSGVGTEGFLIFADDRIEDYEFHVYLVTEVDYQTHQSLCVPPYRNSIYEAPLQGRRHQ